MLDLSTIIALITMISVLATVAATAILAFYERQKRADNKRGVRYKDISPVGFALLENAYRRVDDVFDRILDFDEALNDISESSGLSDSERENVGTVERH